MTEQLKKRETPQALAFRLFNEIDQTMPLDAVLEALGRLCGSVVGGIILNNADAGKDQPIEKRLEVLYNYLAKHIEANASHMIQTRGEPQKPTRLVH